MKNEIVPVSPIFDKTPYYSISYYLKKRSARKKTRKRIALRIISFVCSLNLCLCSVFFIMGKDEISTGLRHFVIDSLMGGLVSDIEISEPAGPAEKPSGDSIPTVAEPREPDQTEAENNGTPTEPPPKPALEAFIKLYEFDYSAVPSGLYPIIPYDLSSEADGELRLYNDTSFLIDIKAYSEAEKTAEGITDSEAPTVLIIHTHGTEGYSEEGVLGYSENYNVPRSYDVTKNVIHIGSVITKELNLNGVNAVQCDVMHDAESYLGAYSRSAETIESYLERYPTIKYVFDIHRDSILLEDKTKTRPVTLADGKVAAQIMTVVGTNELGSYHPDWENNLKLAAKLQASLNESHLGLARSICLRGSTYNQELAPYSLLFEVGSCGNTIKEAEESAKILARKLADLIKNGW